MIRAGSGLSENPVLEKAVFEATSRALDRTGLSKATALLLFITQKETSKIGTVLKKLEAFAGTSAIVGSSAFGVLTEEKEIEQRPSATVLALGGPEETFSPFLIPNLQENNFQAGAALAEMNRNSEIDPSVSLILPDAFSFRHGPFFDGFEADGSYTPLIGGCASEQGGEEKSWQWLGSQVVYDAVSGINFGENLDFETGITQSCQPVGEPLQITRSNGNMIFEIEGRPAYDILLEHVSHLNFEDSQEIFHRLFIGLPLTSFQTDFTRSRYLIRNIMSVNTRKGTLACASQVEEGDYVTFALRDALRAKEDFVRMLDDLYERADSRKPLFGFYFNCCARGTSLYGTSSEDTALIRQYFPSLPLTGFFTFGEIGPVEDVNHLHHYSGVLSLAFERR